jgi:hypothetical protein
MKYYCTCNTRTSLCCFNREDTNFGVQWNILLLNWTFTSEHVLVGASDILFCVCNYDTLHVNPLTMETERVSNMSGTDSILTRLIVRKAFIVFPRKFVPLLQWQFNAWVMILLKRLMDWRIPFQYLSENK